MKKILGNLVAGLLLLAGLGFGSFMVATIPTNLAHAADAECSGNVNENPLTSGVGCAQPQGAPETLFEENGIFRTVTNILIFIVGIIAVVMLIIGGIRYAVSGGDQSAVTSAKNTILYAIIGLIVAFLAFAIVNFVTSQLQQGAENAGAAIRNLLN